MLAPEQRLLDVGDIEAGLRRAVGEDLAALQHQHPRAMRHHEADAVLGHQHRQAVRAQAAQQLAQNRPGVAGALLYEAFADPSNFGSWPDGLPVQVHGMADDPFFGKEGGLDAAREFVEGRSGAELFVYPGHVHLFVDRSLPSYDAEATRLVVERSLAMLGRLP